MPEVSHREILAFPYNGIFRCGHHKDFACAETRYKFWAKLAPYIATVALVHTYFLYSSFEAACMYAEKAADKLRIGRARLRQM